MDAYARIAQAIEFLQQHRQQQPTLADVAAHVHLSPTHFQRLFSQWAGVSPKKLLQVLTLEAAKQQLLHQARQPLAENSDVEPALHNNPSPALSQVAETAGLSTPSRLYDHCVQLEAVTPGEYRSGGAGITFVYGLLETPYGWLWAAMSGRGVHRMQFVDNRQATHQAQQSLQSDWPQAQFIEDTAYISAQLRGVADLIHTNRTQPARPLSLWVKGTNFQINVWRALLQIQPGHLSSYRTLAQAMGRPEAARAVGNAIGANPAALLIPCHRVLQRSGALGGYRWGPVRKQAILVREQALMLGGMQ